MGVGLLLVARIVASVYEGDSDMHWSTSASTVVEMIIKVLLLIILLVVGTVLVVGLVRLGRSERKSITIASFTDTGAAPRDEQGRGVGHEIADALEVEILRIAQLHTLTNPWGSPRELPSLQMTGPQTVERVGGTISVAGVELPVEVVVEILKPLLARPRTQYLITGNFRRMLSDEGTRGNEAGQTAAKEDCRRFPSGHGTRVHILVRLEADGRMLKRWSCKSRLPSEAESEAEQRSALASHVREIAYEIMWVVLEGVEANSFENFKDFIQGVELFRQYKDKKYEVFDEAEQVLLRTIEHNRVYARAHFYLGNLYSWRANYEEDAERERLYEEKARERYAQTAMNATMNPHEAGALSQFGMGLVDYRHYRKAKKKQKSFNIQLLERANHAFKASYNQDAAFYLARTGSALVYKEKAELLAKPYEKKAREGYLTQALNELQYAKAIAVSLKDTDSVKWLERQLLELEFKKRGGDETERKGP